MTLLTREGKLELEQKGRRTVHRRTIKKQQMPANAVKPGTGLILSLLETGFVAASLNQQGSSLPLCVPHTYVLNEWESNANKIILCRYPWFRIMVAPRTLIIKTTPKQGKHKYIDRDTN